MTAPNQLTANMVSDDGSDGCRVGFFSRELTVGVMGCSLDGALVRLLKVYTPEHPTVTAVRCTTVTVNMPWLRLLTRQKQANIIFRP